MSAFRGGRTAWRLNAWATALLAVGVLVAGNRLARRHLELRVDLSEDQLFAPSPVGERMLGELEDVLRVTAFFTGEARLGPVQIAKRRLIDQLQELEEAADGRMELLLVDPNASTEARAEASTLGIQPVPLRAMQGTAEVAQDVYLGLALRYRGRESVLPFVLPQTLEVAFLGGLRKLLRSEPVTVGFLTRRGHGTVDEFTEVRRLLGAQYHLRETLDLDLGEAVPEDVSVLVVARPIELDPRTAFAVDQFLQRGGRALLLIERAVVDIIQGACTPLTSGLEGALEAWGAPVGEGLVWDQERSNRIRTYEAVQVGGEERRGEEVSIPYPFWPNVGVEGLDRQNPVTARLPGADLFWAHPVEGGAAETPAGAEALERSALLTTSPMAWVVPAEEALNLAPQALGSRAVELLARGDAAPRTLAVALRGRFPSPFAGGAPTPRDPIAEALHANRVDRALAAGTPPPVFERGTTEEPVASRASETLLVVVGDADWASDGKFLNERNQLLFVNLIDWLALEDDLLALRSRVPTERSLEDFLEEERRALGLVGPRAELGELEGGEVARLEAQADRAAARRRWATMAAATGGALVLTLVLGALWRITLGRAPRFAAEEEA